jgi:hypothetical protein
MAGSTTMEERDSAGCQFVFARFFPALFSRAFFATRLHLSANHLSDSIIFAIHCLQFISQFHALWRSILPHTFYQKRYYWLGILSISSLSGDLSWVARAYMSTYMYHATHNRAAATEIYGIFFISLTTAAML